MDEEEARKDRTDFITNLYNRNATENKIKNYLYEEGASGSHALIVAEVCNFEVLEKSLGKNFANAVLKETASNVKELFRDSDIIGRISGAQFVIFVKGLSAHTTLQEKANQIISVISNSYEAHEGNVAIFGKVGISIYPSGGRSYEELYSSGLKALYFAKHSLSSDVIFDDSNSTAKRLN